MRHWTDAEVKTWIDSQVGENHWYQTISVRDGITTPGTVDSMRRFHRFNLPEDLHGKSVLDIGCNSGMLCLECKKRNAGRVVGIDLRQNRLEQARILAEIMGLEIEFKELSLFRTTELGRFDIVFCIAVLTEVTDLIAGLEILKQVTQGTLYLELATLKSSNLKSMLDPILNRVRSKSARFRSHGEAKLRRIDTRAMQGWSLIPDTQFLNSIFGDSFQIVDLGPSERYNLYQIVSVGPGVSW